MLRLRTLSRSGQTLLVLEGRLSGPLVDELARCRARLRDEMHDGPIRIDLDGVTFVSAPGKVSGPIIQGGRLVEQRSAEERQVQALAAAADLSLLRYRTGLANYFEVLEAEQKFYPAEDELAQSQRDQLLTVVPATDDRHAMAACRRDGGRHRLAISWHRTVSTLAAIVTIALLTASVHAAPLHESSAMPAAATEGVSADGISDSANPGPCDTSGLALPPERCVPRIRARVEYGPARLLTIDDPSGRSAGETLPIHPVGESPDVLPIRHCWIPEGDHGLPARRVDGPCSHSPPRIGVDHTRSLRKKTSSPRALKEFPSSRNQNVPDGDSYRISALRREPALAMVQTNAAVGRDRRLGQPGRGPARTRAVGVHRLAHGAGVRSPGALGPAIAHSQPP